MARDDQPGADGFGELGGLGAIEIAGYSTLGSAAVDGKQGQIHSERLEGGSKRVVPESVAAVINCKTIPMKHVAKEMATARSVALDGWMGGGDAVDFQSADARGRAVVEFDQPGRDIGTKTLEDKIAIRSGNDQTRLRIALEQGEEGFLIKMVGMIVAAGDEIDDSDSREVGWIDHAF